MRNHRPGSNRLGPLVVAAWALARANPFAFSPYRTYRAQPHGRGTCIENRTSTPSMELNQCGVFSGTRMKSPFAMLRDVPPSIAEPLRFVEFVRVSLTSLPPVIKVAVH